MLLQERPESDGHEDESRHEEEGVEQIERELQTGDGATSVGTAAGAVVVLVLETVARAVGVVIRVRVLVLAHRDSVMLAPPLFFN